MEGRISSRNVSVMYTSRHDQSIELMNLNQSANDDSASAPLNFETISLPGSPSEPTNPDGNVLPDSTTESLTLNETSPAEKPYFIRKFCRKERLDIRKLKKILEVETFTKGNLVGVELFTGEQCSVRFFVKEFIEFFHEFSKTKKLPSPSLVVIPYIGDLFRMRRPERIMLQNLKLWIGTVSSILLRDFKHDSRVQEFFNLDDNGRPQHTGTASLTYFTGNKTHILSYVLRVVIRENGRFSKTYLATSDYRSVCCSLTIYDKISCKINVKMHKKVKNELSLLEQMSLPDRQWPMCPRLLHSFSSMMLLGIATEYCPGGSLENLCKDGPMSDKRVVFVASCLSVAITFLEGQNLTLRTMEVSNVLIDRDGYPVLSDFSLAADPDIMLDRQQELELREIYSLTPIRCSSSELSDYVDYFSIGLLLIRISKGCVYDEFEALIPFALNRDVISMIGHLLRDSVDIADVMSMMEDEDYRSSLEKKQIPSPLVPFIRDEEDTRHYPFARAPRPSGEYFMAYEQEWTGEDPFHHGKPFIDRLHAKSLFKEAHEFKKNCRHSKTKGCNCPQKKKMPRYIVDKAKDIPKVDHSSSGTVAV